METPSKSKPPDIEDPKRPEEPPKRAEEPKVSKNDKAEPAKPPEEPKEDVGKSGKTEPAKPPEEPSEDKLTAEQIYKQLLKSTVWIVRPNSIGSGGLVHRDQKLVLTNYHVVEDDPYVLVFFPSRRENNEVIGDPKHYVENRKDLGIRGKVVVRDPQHDLALVELERLPPFVRALPLASQSPSPGQNVHSIGASGAVREGVLTGTLWRYTAGQVRQVYEREERLSADQHVKSWIVETQAPINPGDSGGPVVNDRIQLVAIVSSRSNSQQLVSQGIDVREVRALLQKHFQSLGLKWEDSATPSYEQLPTLQVLVKRLASPNAKARLNAVKELADMGPEALAGVPKLIPLLDDSDDAVRAAVESALDQIGPPLKADYPELGKALGHKSVKVRLYASRILARPDIPAAQQNVVPLMAAVKDPDATVRKNAVTALGNLGPDGKDKVLTTLIEVLTDEDKAVSRTARESLAKLGTLARSDLPLLQKSLKDPHAEVRLYASAALDQMGPEARDAVPALKEALKDSEPKVRRNVASALGRLGPNARPALAELLAAMKDVEPTVRYQATLTVTGLGRERGVVPALIAALADDNPDVRRAAAEGLPKLEPLAKEDIADLNDALKSDRAGVRIHSALALAKLGPVPQGRSALVEALKEKDPDVRTRAARALAAIGPAAKESVPALADILREKITDEAPGGTQARPALSGEKLFQQVLRSTVWIIALDSYYGRFDIGSGCLVDPSQKLLVTSAHLVEKAAEIYVFFPAYQGSTLVVQPLYYVQNRKLAHPARVVQVEPARNLALLQLATLPETALKLLLAGQSASPGQTIHTIGAWEADYANQRTGTLWKYSQGQVRQVSQREFSIAGQLVEAFFLETQGPLNPGDTGGPVVNDQSQLVAIHMGSPRSSRLRQPSNYGIDVREVRSLFRLHYKARLGKEWTDDGAQPSQVPVSAGPSSPAELHKAAATALGAIGVDAVPALRKLLEEKEKAPRTFACEALAAIGPPAKPAIVELVLALRDPDLREPASQALAKIGPEAVKPLIDALYSKDSSTRLGAVLALGKIGPPANEARPMLGKLRLTDPVPEIREAAAQAILKIQQK